MFVIFSTLVTRHNRADSKLVLEKDLVCAMIKDENTVKITVPLGFETDLASIPRIFGSFYPRNGRYTYPAVLHDYLYRYEICSRAQADKIFRETMQHCNVRFHTRWLFWIMVRAFGWRFYGC